MDLEVVLYLVSLMFRSRQFRRKNRSPTDVGGLSLAVETEIRDATMIDIELL